MHETFDYAGAVYMYRIPGNCADSSFSHQLVSILALLKY